MKDISCKALSPWKYGVSTLCRVPEPAEMGRRAHIASGRGNQGGSVCLGDADHTFPVKESAYVNSPSLRSLLQALTAGESALHVLVQQRGLQAAPSRDFEGCSTFLQGIVKSPSQ